MNMKRPKAGISTDRRRAAAACGQRTKIWSSSKLRWDGGSGLRRRAHRACAPARERGAAGIDTHESDVIDVITVAGQRWIVRDYFENPWAARARAITENGFLAEGRVLAYVSLESADAFRDQTMGGDVIVGAGRRKSADPNGFALNWYNGKSHGTIAKYASGAPNTKRSAPTFCAGCGRTSSAMTPDANLKRRAIHALRWVSAVYALGCVAAGIALAELSLRLPKRRTWRRDGLSRPHPTTVSCGSRRSSSTPPTALS